MFVVCGEALFDLFGTGPSAAGLSFDARIGGSPLNVAIGLARLGETAAFFGGISRDALGGILMDRLKAEGVLDTYVQRNDHLTTLSLVQKDPQGQPAYTFYGAEAADRMVLESGLPIFDQPPRFLHVGSYTVLAEPVASALKTLIGREHARSLISFDPNIRPTVVGDMNLWRKNTDALVQQADIVKASEEDLALIAPGEPVEAVARDWLTAGARLIVVTRGKDGACAYTRTAAVRVPGVPVEVADTVGAGDTFQAALLSGLNHLGTTSRDRLNALDSTQLSRLMTYCTRAAAHTCTRRGADMPSRADLEKDGISLS